MSNKTGELQNMDRNQSTMHHKFLNTGTKKLLSELQSNQIKLEMKHDVLIRHHEYLIKQIKERTHDLEKSNEELKQEISERTQAEKEMKRMALFAELNPSPVLRFNKKGKVLMANPAAVEILKLESLNNIELISLIPGTEKLDFNACICNGAILSHSAQIGDQFFHFIFMGVPDLNIGQIYGSNITEQKNAEAESLRTLQLASIGELAAGVAHEINNPINGIINYVQILTDRSKPGSIEKKIAIETMKESERIAKIVSNLLSFARYEKEEKTIMHIQKVLPETLNMIRAQLKKECINLKVVIDLELPAIKANINQIKQVFLNIINNARYTMNQKYPGVHKNKILEIHGEKVKIDGRYLVRLIFYDHGMGVPDALMKMIMNPFFTTKPRGRGTGLGLSLSYNIINNHEGRLEIESLEGDHTKVIIDLPEWIKAKE